MTKIIDPLTIDTIRDKKLVIGDEYLIHNLKCLGILLGPFSGGQLVFAITYAPKKAFLGSITRYDPYNSRSYYSSTSVDGKQMARNFIPIYNTWKDKLINFDKLTFVVCEHPRYNSFYTKVTSGALNNVSSSKLTMGSMIDQTISSIKNDSKRTTSEYKIARLLTSKLPIDMCEINTIGLIATMTLNKTTHVCTLNRDKVVKAINKWYRMTNEERKLVGFNFLEVLIPNFEQTKIGRLVKRITGKLFTDDAIESFVSTFNSRIIDFSEYKLELISGNSLIKWYNQHSYTKDAHGSLHNSCMRYANLGSQVTFYAKHPHCQMLTLTLAGKLHARALVWTLADGTRYLDRIYSTKPTDHKYMMNWASENGISKNYDTRGDETLLVPLNLKEIGEDGKAFFPYTDTFRCITRNGKYLVFQKINGKLHPEGADKESVMYGMMDLSRGSYSVKEWLIAHKSEFLKGEEISCIDANGRFSKAKLEDCVYSEDHKKYIFKVDARLKQNSKDKYVLATSYHASNTPYPINDRQTVNA